MKTCAQTECQKRDTNALKTIKVYATIWLRLVPPHYLCSPSLPTNYGNNVNHKVPGKRLLILEGLAELALTDFLKIPCKTRLEAFGRGSSKAGERQHVSSLYLDWQHSILLPMNPVLREVLFSLKASPLPSVPLSSLFISSPSPKKNLSSHTNPEEPDLRNVSADLLSTDISPLTL